MSLGCQESEWSPNQIDFFTTGRGPLGTPRLAGPQEFLNFNQRLSLTWLTMTEAFQSSHDWFLRPVMTGLNVTTSCQFRATCSEWNSRTLKNLENWKASIEMTSDFINLSQFLRCFRWLCTPATILTGIWLKGASHAWLITETKKPVMTNADFNLQGGWYNTINRDILFF